MNVPTSAATAVLAPGDWIDRYELLCPVGQGGMGSIWAARLRSMSSFERLFAVKVMLPEFAADASFRAMLLDEGRIAAGILHPNVAQVLDVGEHASGIYLVMEWIDGDTLQRLHLAAAKRSKRVPLPVALRIVADVCAGLHAAHELRDRSGQLLDVVHRDVSPNNIIVTTSGSVKLIDFGIAKARGRAQEETTNGEVKGKLRYMSPEQARGRALDRRADIWSLGAVVHFLLTGDPPYSRGSEAAALYALVQGEPLKPLPASVPEPVAAIVLRALAHDPADRFPTALAMKEAIEAAGDELGVRATTASVESYYASIMGAHVAARRQTLENALDAVSKRGSEWDELSRSGVRSPSNSSVTLRTVVPVALAPEVDPAAPEAAAELIEEIVTGAPELLLSVPAELVRAPVEPPAPLDVQLTSTAAPWVWGPRASDGPADSLQEVTAPRSTTARWRKARRWAALASGAVFGCVAVWGLASIHGAPVPIEAPAARPPPALTTMEAPMPEPVDPPAAVATAEPAVVATAQAVPTTTTPPPARVAPGRRQRPTVVLRRSGAVPELSAIDSRK